MNVEMAVLGTLLGFILGGAMSVRIEKNRITQGLTPCRLYSFSVLAYY